MSTKNCSKCGKAFGCQADSHGCWCEGYTLDAKTLEQLRSQYDNCLCPECLKTYEVAVPSADDNHN